MPQHVIRTNCIVGKLAPKFNQVGKSLADFTFLKFRMLDVDVIEFSRKRHRSKNSPTCENTVARTHGSLLNLLGSLTVKSRL